MSKTVTIKILQDGEYGYFKFPYCSRFLELYKHRIPSKYIDTVAGTGWQADRKAWVFSLEIYEAVEDLIKEAHEGTQLFWQFVNNMEEFMGNYA